MKKILRCAILWLIVLSVLTSCSNKEKPYAAEYPEWFDHEYVEENYEPADPNLVHIQCSTNRVHREGAYGKYDLNSYLNNFYAIKDVPMNDYLLRVLEPQWYSYGERLYRIKRDGGAKQETLTWEIKSAELYWGSADIYTPSSRDLRGTASYYQQAQELDTAAFAAYFRKCVEAQDYISHPFSYPNQSANQRADENFRPPIKISGFESEDEVHPTTLILRLRVHFAEYENIVWDTDIINVGEACYAVYWLPSEDTADGDEASEFRKVLIPLSDFLPADLY